MANEFHDSNHLNLLDAFTGSWGSSSSSFLTSSFESELDSSDTYNEGNEFIDVLTRQLVDYMLLEDHNDKKNNNTPPGGSDPQKPISQVDNQNQNKYRVGKNAKRGRRGNMTIEQMKSCRVGRVRSVSYEPLKSVGSGMRAIFLNSSGSNNGSNGTGVFLPCSADPDAHKSRKKLGCSTALVPTRVLQSLEQHFRNVKSFSPSNHLHPIQPTNQGQRGGMRQKLQLRSTSTDLVEKKLPQEWTY